MPDNGLIIDFHIHLSRPEHGHPWVLDWIRSNFPGDLDGLMEQLNPAGLRRYLQDHGIDWAVGLAEVSPITTGWVSNEFVGKLCAEANAIADPDVGPRGRLLPFASINPFIVNDLAAESTVLDEWPDGHEAALIYTAAAWALTKGDAEDMKQVALIADNAVEAMLLAIARRYPVAVAPRSPTAKAQLVTNTLLPGGG